MNTYVWQENMLKKGFKPGELQFIAVQRQTGKSMITANWMKARFGGGWTDWEKMWTFKPRKSITGKNIWGRIMGRKTIFALSRNSNRVFQYATSKEVFTETLKGKI